MRTLIHRLYLALLGLSPLIAQGQTQPAIRALAGISFASGGASAGLLKQITLVDQKAKPGHPIISAVTIEDQSGKLLAASSQGLAPLDGAADYSGPVIHPDTLERDVQQSLASLRAVMYTSADALAK